MSVTAKLAEEILNTSFDGVPPGAMLRLRRLFADHVGIAYMGYRETGRELCRYAEEIGGPQEAVLLGTDLRVNCEMAAAVNSQMTRNTDFEDTGPGLHPGPVIVHTALAVAQRSGGSGRELLTAMAIGHELNCRVFLASVAGPDVRHANMVAAAIAGRLLGLEQAAMRAALSLAWEFPIKSINYTRPKVARRITAVGMGNIFSARAGVQSALMSLHGFESVPDEIDQLDDLYDLGALSDRANAFYHTEHSLFLKPWPTSHGCHMVLQLIEELVERNDLQPQDIVEIRAGLPDVYLMAHQDNAEPERYWEAIYSTAWAIAMVVHRVPPGPDWFTPQRIADPASRATAARIEIVEHGPGTAAFQKLDLPAVEGWAEIRTRDQTLKGARSMSDTYGSPTTAMPERIFDGKFERVVEPSLGNQQTGALLDALKSIEELGDVRELQPLLMAGQ